MIIAKKWNWGTGMQIHPFTFTHGWGEKFSPKLTSKVNLGESTFFEILGEVRWGERFSPKLTQRVNLGESAFLKILGEVRWGENCSPKLTQRVKMGEIGFSKILGEVRWRFHPTFTYGIFVLLISHIFMILFLRI